MAFRSLKTAKVRSVQVIKFVPFSSGSSYNIAHPYVFIGIVKATKMWLPQEGHHI